MERRSISVIDASVAIKWFVTEEGSDRATGILERLLENPELFVVPELFFFELGNVLNRMVADDGDPRLELLDIILDVGLPRAPMSTELRKLIRTYQQRGLSGYDCAYAALAEYLGGKWITADKTAFKKIERTGFAELL